jgi:hypothetical protein
MPNLPIYEIQLSPENQTFVVFLADAFYNFRLMYNQTLDENASWLLDIADANNVPLVQGLPLVTGEDLLVQLKYLAIHVVLYCFTDGSAPLTIPTFDNLGISSHLYFDPLVSA